MKQNKSRSPKRTPQPKPGFRAELLGRPTFYLVDGKGGETEVRLRSRQSVALLAYLHVRGRRVSRDQIVDLLWHEDSAETARASLRVLLTRLKKLLPGVLDVDPGSVSLVPGSVAWDTERFHALQARGSAAALTEAALLYHGEFMQNFDLRVSGEFEGWLEGEREGWRERYNGLMRQLVDLFLAQGRGSKALFYIERWGRLEPESEAAHRQHMWLSWKEGRSDPAIAKYRKLVKKLHGELGIGPEESTRALYELIVGSLDQEKTPLPVREDHALLELTRSAAEGTDGIDPHMLYQSNLELTSFVGRERELSELVAAVKQGRLVSVWGVGGVGKTRLTLEACRVLQPHFDESVFIFTCEHWEAGAFGRRIDALTASLRAAEGPLLFVFDSFELVSASHAPLVRLLRAVPQASVIVTGRGPLGILGERTFAVSPLPYPQDGQLGSPEQLFASPAVQLFWSRAFYGAPLEPRNADPDDVRHAGRVAQALTGLPLGLEIAASQLAHMPLAELAQLAETSPLALRAEHRTVARHENLAAIVAGVWEELSAEQQHLLVRLLELPERFNEASALRYAKLERRDLQVLTHRGFLCRYPDGSYTFPKPFRHLVRSVGDPYLRQPGLAAQAG